MKVIIFGATGMVGQGVLRECLHDPDVEQVVTIVRHATGANAPKLREIEHANMFEYTSVQNEFRNFDACFFCLGVSSADVSASEYERLTYDLTMAAARALKLANPAMTFIYVSGEGTDSSEQGRVHWAKIKGKTENALLEMFPNAYMFRPGAIEPVHGETSKTTSYRWFYRLAKPLFPLMHRFVPNSITTTERVGQAMLDVAKHGAAKKILTTKDINSRFFFLNPTS